MKSKVVKLFLMLGVITLSIIFSGCSNGKIPEKKDEEIVSFPMEYFPSGISSVPGQPIKLVLEDATFLCKTEKGSFEYYHDTKEYRANSGDTIFYCPEYLTENESFHTKDAYVDIYILREEKIIGYAVIKINYYDDPTIWKPKLIVSNLFIDKSGETVTVSNEYVNGRIMSYHK